MSALKKTNAMRLLDSARLPYAVRTYEFDEDDLSGVHAADAVGMAREAVFKTLVARGDKTGFTVFCIPVAESLDLKKAAKASGNKAVELLPVTGYIRGGCSPVGMKKKFPTYFDETAVLFDEIAVSAGQRGVQLLVNPEALAALIEAGYADLTA